MLLIIDGICAQSGMVLVSEAPESALRKNTCVCRGRGGLKPPPPMFGLTSPEDDSKLNIFVGLRLPEMLEGCPLGLFGY